MNSVQKPDVKAVFFDIDGTLFSFKTKSVPQSTQNALKILRENGIKVIVATGRSINDLHHIKHLEFDGFLTFNGGYCMTTEGKVMFRETIHADDIKNLVDYSAKTAVSFSLMYEDKVRISHKSPQVLELYEHVNLPLPPLYNPDNPDFENVLQANIFIDPESEDSFMKEVMPNSLSSRWTPLFADVNPEGIGKQKGVQLFCDHFNIHTSQTMAFGDGGNDISMLKFVKIGVAMGNAEDRVKDAADFVTNDVDDDGIAAALHHFGIIKEDQIDS